MAFVLNLPTVVSSRPALLTSLHVDTSAEPSQRYVSTSTGKYLGAFDFVFSVNLRFALVFTFVSRMFYLHKSSEFQHGFDDPSMRFLPLVSNFFREFSSAHIKNYHLLRTRTLHSAIELISYTFDNHILLAKRLYQSDFFTEDVFPNRF